MKLLFTTLSFLLATIANAQTDWWCVQPGVKRYFTNDYHYVRGIRVDSVKTVSGNTVLYPFKSPRGYYQSNQKLAPSGSWLGETITIAPDGTHYFDNFWGDTVIIKSQAALFDSWQLYNDTTSLHYTATVTTANVAAVLGVQDSIKEITIVAWDGAGVNTSDPLHNTKMILSKAHGFVQVTDLFMFPLHEPNRAYQRGFDYWLDRDLPSPTVPTASHLYFNLIDFPNPKNLEIYNFNIGDVFEYKADGLENVSNSQLEKLILDEVVEKNVSATSVTYKIARWTYTKNFKTSPPKSTTVPSFVNLTYDAALLLDTTYMPEEWGQKDILRYNPMDTSFCETAPLYDRASVNMKQDSSITSQNPCGYGHKYKKNMGRIWYSLCWDGSFGGTYLNQLLYMRRNGNPCYDYYPLNIEALPLDSGTDIYPNPSNGNITIKHAASTQRSAITVYNLHGQEVYRTESIPQDGRLQLSLPDGVYYVKYMTGEQHVVKKITIIN